MSYVFRSLFSNRTGRFVAAAAATLAVLALTPGTLRAQRSRATNSAEDNEPTFSAFKGVRIGMQADEARKKLGAPRDKSDEQDFYVFNDTEAVQVYYDAGKAVSAISIDYMSGASGVPSCKDVLGMDGETRADGSIYKLMRYPKAGYWVSYSRTAGNSPTVTITIQKIAR